MSTLTQALAVALPAQEKLALLVNEIRSKARQEVDLDHEDFHETQYARQLLRLIDTPNQEHSNAAA